MVSAVASGRPACLGFFPARSHRWFWCCLLGGSGAVFPATEWLWCGFSGHRWLWCCLSLRALSGGSGGSGGGPAGAAGGWLGGAGARDGFRHGVAGVDAAVHPLLVDGESFGAVLQSSAGHDRAVGRVRGDLVSRMWAAWGVQGSRTQNGFPNLVRSFCSYFWNLFLLKKMKNISGICNKFLIVIYLQKYLRHL